MPAGLVHHDLGNLGEDRQKKKPENEQMSTLKRDQFKRKGSSSNHLFSAYMLCGGIYGKVGDISTFFGYQISQNCQSKVGLSLVNHFTP